MALIIGAAKANPALLLPTLLVAAYINRNEAHSHITIRLEDVSSLGPGKAILELQEPDGRSIFDDAILRRLQDSMEVPQAGDRDQVRDTH